MRLLIQIILLFVLAQAIALFTAHFILKDINTNPYVQQFVITENTQDISNAFYLFLYILAGAIVIMTVIHFYKGKMLFRLLEILMIATSSSIVFYAVSRLAFGYDISMTIGIVLGIIFAILKFFFSSLKNAAAIIATAGVGVIFGISLGVWPIIIMLFLLSIYDFVAVFQTKHMVKMAEVLIKNDLAFTVSATMHKGEPRFTEKGERNRIDLGTGDIVAPIMFEVSALSLSPLASLFVFIGACIALVALMYFAMRKKVVLPALPPITLGMLVFFIIGKVLHIY